ncbi:MAG: AbrB/MazE/SpoVT family DNA-binding domain-containing protein [Candidatus Margulisbacteria bacterium]|jgi:AbrB family looped-hinge helix DNA binding protein|nr:AbrB/MazE/SpoVT family DNA-binding domain-containing protein [Candidatus Margulisiibacteriota bacterium]
MNAEIVRVHNGQVNIPADVCQKLGLREGDKAVFFEEDEKIIFANAAKTAFAEMQLAFAGEAERLNLKTEQDIVALVDEVREETWKSRYACGA